MEEIPEFDKICQGPGENIIVDLVTKPHDFPRVILGVGAKSMADWPCLLYTSPSPRDRTRSRMPSSAWKKKKQIQTHVDESSFVLINKKKYYFRELSI